MHSPNFRNFIRRITLSAIVLAAIGGYALFEARRFLEGPVVSVTHPPPSLGLQSERLITLKAQTKNVASISVNDRPTYVTEEGVLQEHVLLQKGYTVIRIAAKDRFGHTTEKELEFYTQ